MRLDERNAAVGRVRDHFPVGMRVLAVDDDPVCLKVLENLLQRCQYHVTTTNQAVVALRMLRQNRDLFDLVISDVHMPDMDGFKLLELVGLEMDLPVIMLSVNGETKTVMKGITHGACDYLLKPVRLEELRNIWQHVVRRKFSNCERANIDGYEECTRPSNADFDHVHSQITGWTPDQCGRPNKKRKEYHSEEEDEGEESNGQENDDPSAPKKPRVVWSVELHRKFVAAVNELGIDKAVPKRILELMNVERLTRENVASHLQKYRLYLKRLSAVALQQASIVAGLGGNDPFMRMGAFEGLQGYQSFASSAALPSFSPQGLLNRNNPTSFGIQGMSAYRPIQIATGNSTISHSIGDPNKYHLSLPDTVPNQKYLNFGGGSNLRQSMDGGNTDNLLNPKFIWSCLPTSQPPNLIGSHHPMSQRPNNGNLGGTMVGQTTASASTAAPQTRIDMFISGDTPTQKARSDLSFPRVHSELSSSSCSFDGLLNSIIKVEKDDASFSDDLGCDFYSLGACI
ncbi:unnamed protein product [Miscanthus lutarioriparius]|uniref:Two-component response regulator n=1 Tax=Miscanthus lutarioriparius TaxID=422564 RepID=A0A811Q1D3_9POAL|nr:unnamed protein product [Miscanthus lutarioriparius]